jgi:hypothetical protein
VGFQRLERAESLLTRLCPGASFLTSRAGIRLASDAFADRPARDIIQGFPVRGQNHDARPRASR